MDTINSAVWVCCTDVIHVQHRDTSFTHFLHGVGVEQFNSLKKNIYVDWLILSCTFQVDEHRLESSRKTHLACLHAI